MATVRAKLVCTMVEPTGATPNVPEIKTGEAIKFETQYNTADSPEDNSYSNATPSANTNMYISDPQCFGAFEVGKAYYFDITPVGE